MSAGRDIVRAPARRGVGVSKIDSRIRRAVVATLVIAGWMALGIGFGLGSEAYLLLGVPIMAAFQVLVIRAPMRAMWLRDAPPLRIGRRSALVTVAVALAPASIVVRSMVGGDLVMAGYGVAGIVGTAGAVYAMARMDRAVVWATVRATLLTSAILVATMVAYRVATGGFDGDVRGAIATAAFSVATYLPVVFVLEEVFFRGLLDTYLHAGSPDRDRASAVFGSALWGLWHLPVMSVQLGPLTVPYLVLVHCALGVVLVAAWRRTGNLAAPGIAHAVSDALRNAVAVA